MDIFRILSWKSESESTILDEYESVQICQIVQFTYSYYPEGNF